MLYFVNIKYRNKKYEYLIESEEKLSQKQVRAKGLDMFNAETGLELLRLPANTSYGKVMIWVVQGYYSGKWEDLTQDYDRSKMLIELNNYRKEAAGVAYRLVHKHEE